MLVSMFGFAATALFPDGLPSAATSSRHNPLGNGGAPVQTSWVTLGARVVETETCWYNMSKHEFRLKVGLSVRVCSASPTGSLIMARAPGIADFQLAATAEDGAAGRLLTDIDLLGHPLPFRYDGIPSPPEPAFGDQPDQRFVVLAPLECYEYETGLVSYWNVPTSVLQPGREYAFRVRPDWHAPLVDVYFHRQERLRELTRRWETVGRLLTSENSMTDWSELVVPAWARDEDLPKCADLEHPASEKR